MSTNRFAQGGIDLGVVPTPLLLLEHATTLDEVIDNVPNTSLSDVGRRGDVTQPNVGVLIEADGRSGMDRQEGDLGHTKMLAKGFMKGSAYVGEAGMLVL